MQLIKCECVLYIYVFFNAILIAVFPVNLLFVQIHSSFVSLVDIQYI